MGEFALRPGGRPLTYGEYRKMRLEHEKAVLKWQQEEESRLQQQQQQQQQEQQQSAQKSETDSPMRSSSDSPDAALAKFKIPKKKRPSSDSDPSPKATTQPPQPRNMRQGRQLI